MKELLKIMVKRLFLWSFIVGIIYSVADYGQSFALSYFGTSPLTLNKIINLSICILASDIIMLVASKVECYLDSVNEVKSKTAIQKYYFNKLQTMPSSKQNEIHTGYVYKLINNVSSYFFDAMWFFIASVIPVAIGGISIFYMVCKQSILTGIICIIISSLAVILKYKMLKNRQKYQKKANEAESKYNAIYVDFIQNITAVKKLSISKFCNRKLTESSEEYLKVKKVDESKRLNTNTVFSGLMDTLYMVVLISTIIIVKNGQDGLPYLLFYMTALAKLYSSLNSLVRFIEFNQKFLTAKKQLDEYFKDNKEIKLIEKFENVKLENVIFSYTKDSNKIKIPKFALNIGDKISIMGESGQGKTTAMNILAGLYTLKQGELIIDGKKQIDKKLDLVFVSQEVELFDLSIRDNLTLGQNISEEKIFEMFEEAGLMEWYKELPQGLDTIVGEKGVKLSAGQKQRLNIIRGILIDKPLYFFDEPTSNLDSVSEEKITNMIEKYLKDKTYVIVTHRPRLKELCNKHYVFENHMMKEVINV